MDAKTILIPVEKVEYYNAATGKNINMKQAQKILSGDVSVDENIDPDDIYVEADIKAVVDAIANDIHNGTPMGTITKKLLNALVDSEECQDIIIKKGLDLAVRRSDGSVNAIMKAAKMAWKEATNDWIY